MATGAPSRAEPSRASCQAEGKNIKKPPADKSLNVTGFFASAVTGVVVVVVVVDVDVDIGAGAAFYSGGQQQGGRRRKIDRSPSITYSP